MAGTIHWRCALPPRAFSLSSIFAFCSFQSAQAVPRWLVPAADWRRGLYPDDDLESRGATLLNDKLRSDAIDLSSFLEAVFVSPPTRVDGTAVFLTRRIRRSAQCPAAQPQAQQGAAQPEPVCHRAQPRGALDRSGRALAGRAAGARLLAGGDQLRFQERPRCAARSATAAWARLRVRAR